MENGGLLCPITAELSMIGPCKMTQSFKNTVMATPYTILAWNYIAESLLRSKTRKHLSFLKEKKKLGGKFEFLILPPPFNIYKSSLKI